MDLRVMMNHQEELREDVWQMQTCISSIEEHLEDNFLHSGSMPSDHFLKAGSVCFPLRTVQVARAVSLDCVHVSQRIRHPQRAPQGKGRAIAPSSRPSS